MKYLIQMQDGSYYVEPKYGTVPGTIFTTSKLTEAKLYDTRFQALSTQARSIKFANSKIQEFDPGEDDPDGR